MIILIKSIEVIIRVLFIGFAIIIIFTYGMFPLHNFIVQISYLILISIFIFVGFVSYSNIKKWIYICINLLGSSLSLFFIVSNKNITTIHYQSFIFDGIDILCFLVLILLAIIHPMTRVNNKGA